MILKLLGLGAAGYVGYRYFQRSSANRAAAYAEGEAPDGVRNAGPEATRDGVEGEWSELDQELDESFPASDPPANY